MTDQEQIDHELRALVNGVARDYARRSRGWWAEEAELQQVAWAAALVARARFDPARGSIKAFARERVKKAVSHHMIRLSTPLSSADNRHRYGLIGIEGADVDLEVNQPLTESPEERLAYDRWVARVRSRVQELVGEDRTAALLNGDRAENKTERLTIYGAIRQLLNDPEIRALWGDR